MADSLPLGRPAAAVPVFSLSDSTAISAETMGNALLIPIGKSTTDASQ
jgi:hypothetical protein